MGKKTNKRKHAQHQHDLKEDAVLYTTSLAGTLAHLRTPEDFQENNQQRRTNETEEPSADDWTVISRGNKRPKNSHQAKDQEQRPKDTYPALIYNELHKLHSSIKIVDLQSLVLYCLADGVSPQWVSVKNRASIRKVVVLFVPGLEKGMFDGEIALENPSNGVEDSQNAEADETKANGKIEDRVASIVTSTLPNEDTGVKQMSKSPDDYLPVRLVSEKLSVPLKPLSEMFTHVWPVKAPGDEKYSKVYSPLHAMLTAPITKSQEVKMEERSVKGTKSAKEGKQWENQRTPITAFIATKDDLLENEYTAHPVHFSTDEEKRREANRRRDARETQDTGWVDTAVESLEDGNAADKDIEQGSLTVGRSVFAIDCEMCKTENDETALTRVSLVDWNGDVILDELVKPAKPIIDYLTPSVFQIPKHNHILMRLSPQILRHHSGKTPKRQYYASRDPNAPPHPPHPSRHPHRPLAQR